MSKVKVVGYAEQGNKQPKKVILTLEMNSKFEQAQVMAFFTAVENHVANTVKHVETNFELDAEYMGEVFGSVREALLGCPLIEDAKEG